MIFPSGFGQDLASECASGNAAACTKYYATVYSSAPSVVTAATSPAPRTYIPATSAPPTPLTLAQIAAKLGGSVQTVGNLGPFGGSVTYVNVGGQLLDANLLTQRFATDGPALATAETQQEIASIAQAAALLPAQTTAATPVSAPGAVVIPASTTTAAPTTGTAVTSPAAAPSWLPSFLASPLGSVSTSTGLSDTTLLLIAAGIVGLVIYMGSRK